MQIFGLISRLPPIPFWPVWPLLAGLIAGAPAAFSASLVENGQAQAAIVVPAGKVPAAAKDLQHYLEKVSGAALPIVMEERLSSVKPGTARIFLGACAVARDVVDRAKLQPEGFVIKSVGNDLYIVGRDTTYAGMPVDGTFYGVCEFLERFLGVRWLMPGPFGEVVPKQTTIRIDTADVRQEPFLWQRRLRNKNEASAEWFRFQRMGSRVRVGYGHAYGGWWDKYHEKYPDIFAQQPNGTRINTNVRERLCVSNPTLWKLVADEKIKELRANPQLTAASISPNDGGANKFCNCERCLAWDSPQVQLPGRLPGTFPLTDRYFRYYNEVAKLVAKEIPDRYLGCYAYSVYRTPPVQIDRLEPNLIVAYVGFSTSYTSDELRASSREEWRRWSRLSKQVVLRPNQLIGPIGFPINWNRKTAEDLRYLAANGLCAIDHDGCVGNWATHGLHYYVLAKLLWNPHAPVQPIVDDYCRSAYGLGAEAMKTYFGLLEELSDYIAANTPERDSGYGAWARGFDFNRFAAMYVNNTIYPQLQVNVDRAIAAIGADDPAALERVKLVAAGLEYTRQTRRLLVAAEAVRAGKSKPADFEPIRKEVLAYYNTLEGGLVVNITQKHHLPLILRSLQLKGAPRS
ncbi:MAG: DUF4838 domain-containing protein, partial [Planctomycetes bacterium]|nr:DUF4838 domain-containing protein [Planctomycetota bacterium]